MTINIRNSSVGRGSGGLDRVVRFPGTPVVTTMSYGSGWYHDAAIQTVAKPSVAAQRGWRVVVRDRD